MTTRAGARLIRYGAAVTTGALVLGIGASIVLLGQQQIPPQAPTLPDVDLPGVMDNLQEEVIAAVVRLPFAAGLGAVLALRPRRRGTPVRQPAVVQTQIILAVVGALIMLVVGSSLARAFGIVGAANLIDIARRLTTRKTPS